jgi:hypothetical protein
MSATWLNDGLDESAKIWLGISAEPAHWTLRLYTNNHAPAVGDHFAAFTESVLAGYASVDLAPGDWTVTTTAGLSSATHAGITFSFSAYAGGTTIYGYVLTYGATTAVLAELLGTPYAVPAGGGSLTVTPTYQERGF